MLSFQRILCPTDFSPCSHRALKLATVLAKESDAELRIVHVYEGLLAYTDGDEVGLVPPADLEGVRADLNAIRPVDAKVRFRHALLIGHPSHEILGYAKDEQVDIIVLGTHGRTGLDRVLMGSVAESILRHAECPVLTVKDTASPDTATSPA